MPHYLFKNGTKRINFAEHDQDLYQADLDTACRPNGMSYEWFLAKKADVFFWTADLAHHSHPRILREGTSRLSCVTHYHPTSTSPFWFRHHPDRTHVTDLDDRGAYVSTHYALSDQKYTMLTPDSPYRR